MKVCDINNCTIYDSEEYVTFDGKVVCCGCALEMLAYSCGGKVMQHYEDGDEVVWEKKF